MGDLVGELHHHHLQYYLRDAPEISDAAYDRLFLELVELEEDWPALRRPDSPTQRVGVPLAPAPDPAGFRPYRHEHPMLSLDNARDTGEFRSFDERLRRLLGGVDRVSYVGELKLDGAAIELIYEDRILVRGATRGDGRVGEDVTANLRPVLSIPPRLPPEAPSGRLSVRGEVLMPRASFRRLNRLRGERRANLFVNPRNATAGSLRQLHNVDLERLRSLEFRAYGLAEGLPPATRTQMEILAALRSWGFTVTPECERCDGAEAAIAYHERMVARRNELDVETDGTVFKVDCLEQQQRAGQLPRAPRWAIAFKFPPQQETTRVEAIEVRVGRTGALTPLAVLHPVFVGGVTVSRASLHNRDEVERKDVRVGDTVVVQRAGDVIPQVVAVVPALRPPTAQRWRMPTHCPVCDTPVQRLPDEVVTRCTNLDCPAQLVNNLCHLASRAALDIEGLGEKLAEQLVAGKHVVRISDLFALDAERLAGLERMAEKSGQKLRAAIDSAMETSLTRFLIALGIRHVGAGVAQLLADHVGGDLDLLMRRDVDELAAIEGVGGVIAESAVGFFADPRNRAEIARLRELGVRWPQYEAPTPQATGTGPLAGKRLVLSGGLNGMSREEAARRIEAAGGSVTSSVSTRSDYLVVGARPGSKLAKAEKLGVTVLDKTGLLELVAP